MAKVFGPLHSLSASGSIGSAVSFRATKGGAVVTAKVQPYNPSAVNQLLHQTRMKEASIAFAALDSTDLTHWGALASKYHRSKFACFWAEYQYQNIEAPGAPLIPEALL